MSAPARHGSRSPNTAGSAVVTHRPEPLLWCLRAELAQVVVDVEVAPPEPRRLRHASEEWVDLPAHGLLSHAHAKAVAKVTNHLVHGHAPPATNAVRPQRSHSLQKLRRVARSGQRLHPESPSPNGRQRPSNRTAGAPFRHQRVTTSSLERPRPLPACDRSRSDRCERALPREESPWGTTERGQDSASSFREAGHTVAPHARRKQGRLSPHDLRTSGHAIARCGLRAKHHRGSYQGDR